MKILIVSYFFPPYNCVGSVRVGKTAKYLIQLGHDVRVISADDQPLQKTLDLEIPSNLVYYTQWFNVNFFIEKLLGGREKIAQQGYVFGKQDDKFSSKLFNKIKDFYKCFFHFPDQQIGWLPFAVNQAKKMLETWQPDIIYASAMPFTSLLVAAQIHYISGIPWIAEFRDLWTDGHNYHYPMFRSFFEKKLEYNVLRSSKGLVTVSQPLAETLKKYNKSVEVIFNGFDPNDYPTSYHTQASSEFINITYTGIVYPAKQEIKPFFDSIEANLPAKINFYSRTIHALNKFIKNKEYINNCIFLHHPIPHKEALKAQYNADVLLFFLWKNKAGILSGKIFEYIGAGKPILAIGSPEDSAAKLIKNNNLGVVLSDPKKIADQIKDWADQKKKNGCVSYNSNIESYSEFTRLEQTKKLESFLKKVLLL
ncbi:MAG: glycosyltransferase family 4 protein [Symploca sp. SIO1C2]|nr:glycosyltransferase family 4 protein [Symploca sp. SIO1C2]